MVSEIKGGGKKCKWKNTRKSQIKGVGPALEKIPNF